MKIDFTHGISRARIVLTDPREAAELAAILTQMANGEADAHTCDGGVVICLEGAQ